MPANFDLFTINNPVILDGSASGTVLDKDGDPNLVIDVDSPFTVRATWSLSGLLAPALGGTWLIRAVAESIGPGPDLVLGTASQPCVCGLGTTTFTQDINVGPGLPADGTYKLTVVITHMNNGIRSHMAGFYEGPIVQFYKAP